MALCITMGTGDMVLLRFSFLTSGSSAPVRTGHISRVAAWIMGTLAMPGVRGRQWPREWEICVIRILF